MSQYGNGTQGQNRRVGQYDHFYNFIFMFIGRYKIAKVMCQFICLFIYLSKFKIFLVATYSLEVGDFSIFITFEKIGAHMPNNSDVIDDRFLILWIQSSFYRILYDCNSNMVKNQTLKYCSKRRMFNYIKVAIMPIQLPNEMTSLRLDTNIFSEEMVYTTPSSFRWQNIGKITK